MNEILNVFSFVKYCFIIAVNTRTTVLIQSTTFKNYKQNKRTTETKQKINCRNKRLADKRKESAKK